jgi:hypothetical protein
VEQILAAIDQMDMQDLIMLDRIIVERVKLLNRVDTLNRQAQFRAGMSVTFLDNQGAPLCGIILKMNPRTVSIMTEDLRKWTVDPHLLTQIEPLDPNPLTLAMRAGKR